MFVLFLELRLRVFQSKDRIVQIELAKGFGRLFFDLLLLFDLPLGRSYGNIRLFSLLFENPVIQLNDHVALPHPLPLH